MFHPSASCLLVLSSLAIAVAYPATTPAAVIHVPGDQPTIQAGIDVAQPGDIVLVAPGTYTGPGNKDLDPRGRVISVVSEAGPLATIIDLQGVGRGFNIHTGETLSTLVEGFTIRDGGGILIAGASPTIRNCVLAGNSEPGMTVLGVDQPGGPFPDPLIDHCTFEANAGEGLWLQTGNGDFHDCTFSMNARRGIYTTGGWWGGGDPVFERCTITENNGGGIHIYRAGSTFTDCAVTDHTISGDGAGVLSVTEHGQPRFVRCLFAGNHAGGRGGAFATPGDLSMPVPYFEDCTFEANSARRGGGIWCGFLERRPVSVQGCRFLNNSASEYGGAYHLDEGDVIIERSVFWNNTAPRGAAVASWHYVPQVLQLRSCTMVGGSAQRGAGVCLAGEPFPPLILDRTIIAFSSNGEAVACLASSPQLTVTCSDLFGNAGGDWVGCLAGMSGQNGNISADPLFCDRPGGDFRLEETSPCAPGQSGDCGLIGALPTCGATAILPSTWGSIKAAFR